MLTIHFFQCANINPDNALFANEMNHLGQNIGNAVVPLGLPTSVLPRFLEAFISHSEQDLSNIPGVTPEILKTATSSLLNTYLSAFKHIWIVASCFVAVAAVSECQLCRHFRHYSINETQWPSFSLILVTNLQWILMHQLIEITNCIL